MQKHENLVRITSYFSKNSRESRTDCMLANRGLMYLSVSMQRELSLNFHRNNVYGHLELLEHVSTFTFNSLNWFCKLAPCDFIRYFCENSMIAHAALVIKDTFAQRFASIQWILDSVEFLENSEVILARYSRSCVFMLPLSLFVVVFRFCKVGQLVWCIKCH